MNRGFGRKVLQILEDLNIGWEHMPTVIVIFQSILRSRELENPIRKKSCVSEVQKAEVSHARNRTTF